jgi:uncharacterized protein (TIGR00369 family)
MAGKSEREIALQSIERAPYAAMLGMRIESASGGIAVARMPFRPALLNDGGADAPIHGGAIASLADFAACAAVWSLEETVRSATVTLALNFTGPGIQSDLIARASVRRRGRRIASVGVEIRDQSDALIADALVTYKIA